MGHYNEFERIRDAGLTDDNPMKRRHADIEPLTKEDFKQRDPIRRVLQVLDDKVELSQHMTATESYDLAVAIVEAIRGE